MAKKARTPAKVSVQILTLPEKLSRPTQFDNQVLGLTVPGFKADDPAIALERSNQQWPAEGFVCHREDLCAALEAKGEVLRQQDLFHEAANRWRGWVREFVHFPPEHVKFL